MSKAADSGTSLVHYEVSICDRLLSHGRYGATSLHVPTHDASRVSRNGAAPSSTAATTRETRGRTR